MTAEQVALLPGAGGPPRATVNKIIPFSCVDGPGNRTAVFLQGCNFDCRYCHNPETIQTCVHCGACKSRCPYGLDTPELLRIMLEDYDAFYAAHHND